MRDKSELDQAELDLIAAEVQADAITDEHVEERLKALLAVAPVLVCPVCALSECRHNLPYVEKT